MTKLTRLLFIAWIISGFSMLSLAGTSGSISGIVKDPTGAVIGGALIKVANTAQGIQSKSVSDAGGGFIFHNPPVGRYDLHASAQGFNLVKQIGIAVDADSALRTEVILQVAEHTEKVAVSANSLQVEVDTTQVGDVCPTRVQLLSRYRQVQCFCAISCPVKSFFINQKLIRSPLPTPTLSWGIS